MAPTLSTEAKADSRAAELRASGAIGLRFLAAGLKQAGIAPPRGTTWSPMALSRTLARIEGAPHSTSRHGAACQM